MRVGDDEMTTVYFMRHSESLKPRIQNSHDSLQLQNEKWILSINGERIAEEKSKMEELKNFDVVYASNYVRAISTAKYFKEEILVDESFGERKVGIDEWKELHANFEKRQFEDFDYKTKNGESLNEVIEREEKALMKILETHPNQKILIVGHSTAMAALFSKWCNINGPYTFQGKEFFDGNWNYCETFKLEFQEKTLINIEKVL